MSNLILDRPITASRPVPRPAATTPALETVGSYVDTDGVRRAPARAGSYVGRSATTAVGSYTDRDGARHAGRRGSYVSAARWGS